MQAEVARIVQVQSADLNRDGRAALSAGRKHIQRNWWLGKRRRARHNQSRRKKYLTHLSH
jgi:hypothetical protein